MEPIKRIIVAGPGRMRTVPAYQQTVATLREMGHTVKTFDLSWRRPVDLLIRRPLRHLLRRNHDFLPGLQSNAALNRRLVKLAADFKADLFITIFGFNLNEGALRQLRRQGVRTVLWWLNDPFHSDQCCRQVRWYDLVFTNAPACVPIYHQIGFANVHGLLHGSYPPWHHPVTLTPAEQQRYGCDIVFAGDWEQNREDALLRLVQKYRIKIWGPWKRKLREDSPLRACLVKNSYRPQELARIFATGKIVLNLHTWFERDHRGTNPRVFEAAGCGAFQLCDWKEEIPASFTDGKEIVLYRTLEEMEALVAYFLPLEETRRAIGYAAQKRANQEHSYQQRMQTIIDTAAAL